MFDFLFKKKEVQKELSVKSEYKGEDIQRKVYVKLPEIKDNMIVELLNNNNEIITELKVTKHGLKQLEFSRLPGVLALPVFDENTELIIRGITSDENYFMLKGKVHESTKLKLVIKEQEAVDTGSKRAHVRYFINRDASLIYKVNGKEITEKVQLVDISLNGACIRTSLLLDEDKIYRLRVELYKGAGYISFNCQVVRKSSKDDLIFDYGLLFEELDNHKLAYLKNDLEEIRRRLS